MKKTVKRLLAAIMTAVMILTAIPFSGIDFGALFASKASAIESGKCGDNVYYTFDDKTGVLTISGSGKMEDYQVDAGHFFNEITLKKVIIQEGVTSIGCSAFACCTELVSIIIPNSVKSIGAYAFDFCPSLTEIVIPSGVSIIYAYTFRHCGLSSITIPDGVTNIGVEAFYGCKNLKNVSIPASVTTISEEAFHNCESLTSISIPASVTSIEYDAFAHCNNLTNITIDKNNKVYDSRNNCNAIIETNTNTLLYGCKNTVIPNGITSIERNAFFDCVDLASITIPNGIVSIGYDAFCMCTGLTNITLPDSITCIGEDAFYDTGYYNNPSNWDGDSLYIGCHLIEVKESVTGSYIIENGTKTIADGACSNCKNLIDVTIPGSVRNIGDGIFWRCDKLKSIKVSSENKVFDSRNNCNAIIETKSNSLMLGCKNTIIPDGVTNIGDKAFYGCTSLSNITIPGSVTSIGAEAFYFCESLTSITIPDGVTEINNYSFGYCSNLRSVTIPKSVKNIEFCAFDQSYLIEDVYYTGSKSDWEKITILDNNDSLSDATIHYNSKISENVSDTRSGINMDIPNGVFSNQVTLNVESVLSGSALDIAEKQANVTKCSVFSIETISNGKVVQPDGFVTVNIPIPNGYNAEKTKVYYIDTKNNTASEVYSFLKDGYIVFQTNHFSDWAIVEENSGEQRIPTVTLSASSVTVKVGKTAEVTRTVNNPDKLNIDVKYGIKDKAIATVTANNGKYIITGVKTGSTVLQATVYEKGTTNVLSKTEIPVTVENNGKVKSVSVSGLDLNYKSTGKLNPKVETEGNVKYTVTYKSSDSKVATVDNSGNVKGVKEWGKKTATITCTVTDEFGNVVTGKCNVTCGYAWWQWIIGIVLFGWIWY